MHTDTDYVDDDFIQSIEDIGLEDRTSSMKLVFKDSYQFLTAGLATLVDNTDKGDLVNTALLADEMGIDLDLLTRKGSYPYNYMNDVKRFKQVGLPSRKQFYDNLTNKKCSKKDHSHAKKVWRAARCMNFGDYHNLYLKTDVHLLADVFQNFRTFAHKTYGLDPAHYYTMPGFSWAALFKFKNEKGVRPSLELISDPDIYIAFESSLRGGVCVASNKYFKANNPQCEDYDESKIQYFNPDIKEGIHILSFEAFLYMIV
jgi:hypothetical protein